MTEKTYTPFLLDIEAGKTYAWCQCGLSGDAPLCDGSHRDGSGQRPLKFVADATKTVYLCVCTHTKTPPYCDGSHTAGGA